jgi:hypothetical protein
VLVRRDLPAPQIAVQAIHAAIEATRQFLPTAKDHPHLVLCGVADQRDLLAAADHLFRKDIRFCLFREPDRDNEATALATEPIADDRRRCLDRFRCLSVENFVPAAVIGRRRFGAAGSAHDLFVKGE